MTFQPRLTLASVHQRLLDQFERRRQVSLLVSAGRTLSLPSLTTFSAALTGGPDDGSGKVETFRALEVPEGSGDENARREERTRRQQEVDGRTGESEKQRGSVVSGIVEPQTETQYHGGRSRAIKAGAKAGARVPTTGRTSIQRSFVAGQQARTQTG